MLQATGVCVLHNSGQVMRCPTSQLARTPAPTPASGQGSPTQPQGPREHLCLALGAKIAPLPYAIVAGAPREPPVDVGDGPGEH
eukprot:8227129-Alexandrium_andersonii.AAC.1